MTTTDRSRYITGSKADVLRSMAYFATRDQEAIIDAYTPRFGDPDETAAEAIQSAKDNIKDYRKFLKTISY